jgi:hypothetical protein
MSRAHAPPRSLKQSNRKLRVRGDGSGPVTGRSTGENFSTSVQKYQTVKNVQIDSNVYIFSPTTAAGGVTQTYSFQASNLPDSAAISKWDMYRIDKIDIVAKPYNLAGYAGATTNNFCLLSAFDPDDNTTATITGIASKQTCKVHDFNESWVETIRPKVSRAVYGAGVFDGYEIPEGEVWLDSDYLSVPHFGFKLAAAQAGAATSIQLIFRYHLSLRMNQ